MKFNGRPHTDHGLDQHGLYNLNAAYWNLPTPELYEQAILRHEGSLAHMGPLVVRTGHHTGGSAEDRFVVEEASSSDDIWWGRANKPIPAERFDLLHQRLASYLQMKEVYVQDCFLGAEPGFRLPVRVITEYAWHSLFAHNLFIQPDSEAVDDHDPEFTIIDVPRFHAVPSLDRTRSETFVLINFAKRLALIGGTSYAGEIKKALFAVVNYLMPARGVLPMHCAANQGHDGGVALFFGLGGAGKTTLSADRTRRLIGDDAHGWGPRGVFNFEGGCYAKMHRLSPEEEPDIFATTQRFGTVLENVTVQAQTRRLDLDDDSLTENTRGAYHISAIPNAVPGGVAGHPESLIFLACDAFGVLPPVARLSTAQALYHFLCGYTARLPGRGSGRTEPTPVFSPCYGAPFVPLHPKRYADLLRHRLGGPSAAGLAGQHRLVRRALGRGAAHRPCPHAGAGRAPSSPAAWIGSKLASTQVSDSRSPWPARASPRPCSIPAAPGATQRPTIRRPVGWPGCTGTTSRLWRHPGRAGLRGWSPGGLGQPR